MSDTIRTIPALADLRARRDEILAVAEHYGVSNVRVFGSVAREESMPGSDIDLLVDLPPHYSLLKLSGLVRSLRELLGCRVEVSSAAHLRDEMRETILQDARPL
jgi:predicted nucleotidyltransferase